MVQLSRQILKKGVKFSLQETKTKATSSTALPLNIGRPQLHFPTALLLPIILVKQGWVGCRWGQYNITITTQVVFEFKKPVGSDEDGEQRTCKLCMMQHTDCNCTWTITTKVEWSEVKCIAITIRSSWVVSLTLNQGLLHSVTGLTINLTV